ncbi:MAG: bifunctional methylenetetrahydrofolate dehydrogenase/methenyltetrahydrofolate cyclohydrolase FolD [Acidobacteria bacterium]|nr:bifunctional methylenetetrahydrofolate dehydrogenase/methenyltetrahydrofolate cyclohydrolase FolD [Acidobacteriota bacterium]MBI3488863.1 bifunctional methylenetetrahydrofolate dehydrogenase/methenyltetrahydrofolate cyclohydrolase FolD [Acidobacteriota bacterium]
MATILDGKAHADRMLETVRQGVEVRLAKGLRAPGLAVVLVGEDPASQVYVRNKSAACAKVGITSIEHRLPADTAQADLDALIDRLNADSGVDGILVQLPLPQGLDSKRALHRISPAKDVDGFHPVNQGLLLEGLPGLRPCTPSACMSLLAHHGVELKGIRAVVLGRSEIVGKPMALMLLEQHATVTIAHSRTKDLAGICREADLLVAAVGRPGLVEGSWIKPGAVVVDVGINRVEDEILGGRIFAQEPKKLDTLRTKGGVLCGDVRYGEAMAVASAVTPVPGGVGPLTIAGLLTNALAAANREV